MNIEDYIEKGTKKLTSGLESNIYYNFRKLTEKDRRSLVYMLEVESGGLPIVGIMTMGYEIAKLTENRVFCYNPKENTIKNNYNPNLSSKVVKKSIKKYVIFDDVITTFGTIRKCVLYIERLPEKIICIKNRMNVVELI